VLRAFDAKIYLSLPQLVSPMIGRMIRAFGADDVVCLGQEFKKRRFQMIADTSQ
jgi:hypothetical protein